MGWIAKTFGIIGIIFLILLVIAGLTAYQAISLIKTVQTESASIEQNAGDCSKINNIEDSFNKIKSKAENACLNPIIRIATGQIEQIPMKCKDLPELENQMNSQLIREKTRCQSTQKNSTIVL